MSSLTQLLSCVENKDTIVLTPNNRLSLFLQHEFKTSKVQARQSILSPKIFPLTHWIEYLWCRLKNSNNYKNKVYLSIFSQQLLWEKIIISSNGGSNFFKLSNAVKNVLQAWRLCRQWNIPFFELEKHANNNLDYETFITWSKQYVDLLLQNNWVDYFDIVDSLVNSVSSNYITLPKTIILYGFDDLAWQYTKLLSRLEDAGVNVVNFFSPSLETTNSYKLKTLSFEQELAISADFAKQQFNQANSKTIGIVVPQLEKYRDKVVAEFNRVFESNSYNISAPIPLNSYKIIEAGFELLQLNKTKLPFNLLSNILRSPYIGLDNNNSLDLLKFELFLRKFKAVEFSWHELIQLLNKYLEENDYPETKFSAIHRLYEFHKKYKYIQQNLDVWAEVIKDFLKLVGWPGKRELAKDETELLDTWQKIIEDFAKLSFLVGEVSFAKAVAVLQSLAFNTPFLPKTSQQQARVQVLGILEASGMEFDTVWVVGLNNTAWPSEPAPNPFIPLSLQIKKNIPRSSPKRELEIAKNLTARLKNSARELAIFSYATFVDEEPAIPSGLIVDLADFQGDTFKQVVENKTKLNFKNIMENLDTIDYSLDSQGPILLPEEGLEQGSNILKLQAECPFRAFAEVRLRALPLEEPQLNITKAEKGEKIHRVLANFWTEIKDLTTLKALDLAETHTLLNSCIDQVFAEWEHKKLKKLDETYLKIEKRRLLHIVLQFIDLEKKREDFQVATIEKTHFAKIGPLSFKLRVDRMDKLNNDTYILLDYKTAKVDVGGWFGPRLSEPQLPLYMVSSKNKYSALAFVQINPEETKFKGMAEVENILPKVSTISTIRYKDKQSSWDRQIAEWKISLNKLANEFYAGYAKVDPKNKNISCRYCKLQNLCRV